MRLKDPPVRPDGACVECGGARHPERSRKYAGATAELDPFCSNGCARAWWLNPIPARSIWGVHYTGKTRAAA